MVHASSTFCLKKIIGFSDEFVEFCPNDKKTRLVSNGTITYDGKRYEESAVCPDCKYIIYRKPSDESIEKYKKYVDRKFGKAI